MKNYKERHIEYLKKDYPKGTEVELIFMEDVQAPPKGTKGKVTYVDAVGTIHVEWETGSYLGLIDGVDQFKVIRKGDRDEK